MRNECVSAKKTTLCVCYSETIVYVLKNNKYDFLCVFVGLFAVYDMNMRVENAASRCAYKLSEVE